MECPLLSNKSKQRSWSSPTNWLLFLQIQRMCWEITRLSNVRNPPVSVARVMPAPTTTIAKTEEEAQENTNTGTAVLGILFPSERGGVVEICSEGSRILSSR